MGVSGAYEKYSQSGANNHSFNGNLNNLGAGFRIAPRWYGAIFMAPVSSVGYAISLEQDVAGTNGETVTSLFQGGRRIIQSWNQRCSSVVERAFAGS